LDTSGAASEATSAKPAPKNSTAASSKSILKVSDKKTEENKKSEEKIIGELIDLPEENWQPLSMVPAQFIKQLFSRWL
jgi:hypothetical protein